LGAKRAKKFSGQRESGAGVKGQNAAFRRALLAWFRKHARSLPWRARRDAYAIWVSEVMLQQTQVQTVVPYFQRFLRVFPTLESLARAPYEEVARLWSGLGYYRRAKMLHEAAQQAVKRFEGRFPLTYDDARTLPGVGHYTASAVLSIAYGTPLAVLDGNVARVMARMNGLRGNLHQGKFRRDVERQLARLLPESNAREFNQAMMELGQTVCTPQSPRCGECPVQTHCAARRHGKAEDYPSPRPRRAAEIQYMAAAVIRRNGRVALVRGLEDGLLEDLWNFPAAFGHSPKEAGERLRTKLRLLAKDAILSGSKFGSLKHSITYRSIHVDLYAGEIKRRGKSVKLRWVALPELRQAAVSQLARKIAIQITTEIK
jgi:A/G-specific adenine glycosylase